MDEFDLAVQKFGTQLLNGFWHVTKGLLQCLLVERPRLGGTTE